MNLNIILLFLLILIFFIYNFTNNLKILLIVNIFLIFIFDKLYINKNFIINIKDLENIEFNNNLDRFTLLLIFLFIILEILLSIKIYQLIV